MKEVPTKKSIEFNIENLIKILEYCKDLGKIAIYCHFDKNNLIEKVSISYNKDNIFYVDQIYLREDVINLINSILLSNGILKIVYDIRKIKKVFPIIEKVLCSVDDLMVMSYSLDTGKHNHSIESIFGYNLSKKKSEPFSSKSLISIHEKLIQRLFYEKVFSIYERFDKPLMKVIISIENIGRLLNINKLKELSNEFSNSIAILENDIYNLVGEKFNIYSSKQLSNILFKKIGINNYKNKKLKSGFYSTNFEVLESLKIDGYEIADKILAWRHLSKLNNTYINSLIKKINPFDGRVHTRFFTTSTGRICSSSPNLQNIPIRSKEGNLIRQAFIVPDGYKIISADYSQIELRLLAHIADIALFKQAFVNGQDIHNITARQIFGVRDSREIDEKLRQKAKSINFSIIYGITPFKLASKFKITFEKANEYINYYFSCYPEIKAYIQKELSIARQNGYVKTLFGRKCFIKNINSKVFYLRQIAERAAINAPVQGTAADIIKLVMIKLHDQLKTGKIILQVHDELLLEVEDSKVEETAETIKNIMENSVTISVPLEVRLKISNNWGQPFRYDKKH